MLNIKECTPRSFRIDRVATVAAIAAAAFIAVAATPSFAQTTTSMGPGGISTVTSSVVEPNYRVLADQDLDYFAIKRAQAYGMNDTQIAEAAKLAHYGMVPMNQVLSQIECGKTMAGLAMSYGVSLNDLNDTTDWQNRISDYMTAYRSSGLGALRNYSRTTVTSYSSTGAMYNNMNTAPAVTTPDGSTVSPNGTTVTPNGTTVAPNGTTVTPNGTTITPNGTTVEPNGTTAAPNGTTVTPNGTTITPSGT
ncbi:MAG TPA: hypothetical protein VFW40_12595, partial [Capsulimonadaceae bacterium]|nr:hypothetical protein [Capsulimonadaceae bacterium]